MFQFINRKASGSSPTADQAEEKSALPAFQASGDASTPVESAAQVPAVNGGALYIARQPIFDRDAEVRGYELLFRSGRENRFTGTDFDVASATNIEQSASAFGLDDLVGDRIAWVNLSRGALLAEYYRFLPAARTMIELLESVEPDREVVDACARLKSFGYRMALDDYSLAQRPSPLLALADMVKVDFRQPEARSDQRVIQRIRDRGIFLLAEKVETLDEHREAIKAGYDLFQGYFYCHPEIVETRELAPSRLAQIRFLSEVSREDASFERLEELFESDVALTTRLLRYLNSAAFGWRHEIPSLRHALSVIGLVPLRKWAMMMGLMRLGDERPRELLVTSLSRARFAEELGPPSGLPDHRLDLFLAGMLSVVDALVGRPMREVLAGLAVPTAVRQALTGGDHPVGSVLRMVKAYERGDWSGVESAPALVPVGPAVMDQAYQRSLSWAEATTRI